MKTLTFGLVLGLLTFVFGQNAQNNFKRASSKALLFSFKGLNNLNAGTFNGGLGGKVYFKDNVAIYAGLKINYRNITTPANLDSNETGYDGEDSNLDIGLSAGVEWHPIKNKRVSPYFGGGVTFSMGSRQQYDPQSWDANYTGIVYKRVTETTGIFSFDIFGTGGVEFFITKEISLAAEYHIGYSYLSNGENKVRYELVQGHASIPFPEQSEKNTSINSFGFSTNGFLTLAVYF